MEYAIYISGKLHCISHMSTVLDDFRLLREMYDDVRVEKIDEKEK